MPGLQRMAMVDTDGKFKVKPEEHAEEVLTAL
jgi:hypothetical protein